MKKNLMLILIIAGFLLVSEKVNSQYIDLTTGRTVNLIKHSGNGVMYNTSTSRPVYLYINQTTNDTFYGRTGENVNGKLFRNKQGMLVYDNDIYVYRNGDYHFRSDKDNYNKKVFDRDGDVILKGNNGKMKTEIDGDVKLKEGNAKAKLEGDGVLKDKDGTYKKKIDGDGNILEKDSTYKTKINVDGSVKLKDENYKGKLDENGDLKEKSPAEKRKMKKDNKTKVKTDDTKAKSKADKMKVKTDQ